MCNKSGVLFTSVHVYKAAGSYISEWLKHFCRAINGRFLFWSVWGYHTMSESQWMMPMGNITPSRQEPSSSSAVFMLATIRDPVERFISAMHELIKHGKWSSPSLTGLLDAVDRRGFWEPHLYPQFLFLTRRDGHPLPLDYIGRGEFAEEARALLHLKMSVAEPLQTMQLKRKTEVTLSLRQSNATIDRIAWASPQEVKRICSLYHLDYTLLHLPFPSVCSRDRRRDEGSVVGRGASLELKRLRT